MSLFEFINYNVCIEKQNYLPKKKYAQIDQTKV
jgi:hypothetical protein